MFFYMSVYMFLAIQIYEWRLSEQAPCIPALKSKKTVEACPTSKDEWDSAARKMNCEDLALKQNCTTSDKFKYHCVINSYRNETVEVCAPAWLILGYCTEFNDKGAIIQMQSRAPCNNSGFPKCPPLYKSTEAYKFQDCYMLVYKKRRIPSTFGGMEISKTNANVETTIFTTHDEAESGVSPAIPLLIATVLLASFAGIFLMFKYYKWNRERNGDLEEQTSLLSIGKNINMKKDKKKNEDESMGYMKQNETVDKYFVETRAYQKGEDIFRKYGIVIWTGPPGCGKTQAAFHLILKIMNNDNTNCIFRRICSSKDMSYIEKDKRNLILLDNIFFQQNMDSVKIWWKCLGNLHKSFFESNGNELAHTSVRLIITAREEVIERACLSMGNTTPVLNDNYRVNANVLTGEEKEEIFSKQRSFAKNERHVQNPVIDQEFLSRIKGSDGPIGFPLCAHLYVCSDEYKKSGVHFFSRPIEYLKLQIKDEMKNDRSNRTKTLFLVLFFHEWQTKLGKPKRLLIQNENECKELLQNAAIDLVRKFAPLNFRELENEAQRLVGSFLKEESEDLYNFVHDSVYEAVGAFLCETYVTETAMYFPLDIIQNQDYENATESQQRILVTRMLSESLAQNLSKVFACRLFQQRNFVTCFLSEFTTFDKKKVRKFFTQNNMSSTVKLPCLFWTSFNKLVQLTEQFYLIISRFQINPDHQLYVSLYGECCAGNEFLLCTIDPGLQYNFEEIKRRVLGFGQKEDMPILHLVISSERSDKFAAEIVEKLLHDEIPVDIRNKRKLTPLMTAVNQTQQRTQVISTLIKHSPKLTCKDWNDSNVLHHCLGSSLDDDTCANYLNILLSLNDANTCLHQENFNGNKPLSIAAMQNEYSRICSILLLLKCGSKSMMATINDDGYSPLQLCIRSLKGKSAYVELECCVRIILLLLHGGSPDNISDKNDIAIEECEFVPVKDILSNPTDEKTMIDALDSMLKTLEDDKTTSEPILVFPEEISTNMQSRITRATKILKNLRLV